jgi:glycolate oxidase iron-sulfur subunit
MIVELAEKYAHSDLGQEAESLLQPCVQCGQCTPVCPTFRLLNDEWDGPRGRIFLIKQFLEGKEPTLDLLPPALNLKTLEGRSLSGNLQLHLDRCLTCRSCETSCPEGVKYGRLLDIARELVEEESPRPTRERVERKLVRTVVARRHWFTTLLRTGQALRRRLPAGVREWVPERRAAGEWPERSHERRMLVWQGCVQPALAPDINAAAARVLNRFGIRLTPSADGCCGSLAQHMASPDEARSLMRKSIDALWPQIEDGVEAVVLTASGCGMHFRDYGNLLKDDPDYRDKARRISEITRDIGEVVAAEWPRSEFYDFPKPEKPRRIAFQSSCSLQHGEKLNGVVEGLLKNAGFKLVPVSYKFLCCGAAGTYSILQREMSTSLRASKMKTLLASRPSGIATANIGCLTHLAAASPVPVNHWIELLDEAFVEAGL